MWLFYGIVLSSERKLFSETSYLGNSSTRGVFPLSILVCLLMKLKLKKKKQKPAKQSIHSDSKDSQLSVHYS